VTIESPQLFEHTLSFPEHIWLGFFQEYFQQEVLFVDQNGLPIGNRFVYEPGTPESNRKFDIKLAFDFTGSRQNLLPQLVVEDTGVSMVGVAVNQLRDWEVTPRTSKERADLLRTTYIFHCLSKDRGESRTMAAVVLDAIMAFKDQLYENGLNKIEPMSVGATQAMRSDSDEDFIDTPVQVTFEYLQIWRTVETSASFFNRFCFIVEPHRVQSLFRASMDVSDSESVVLFRASLDATSPNNSYLIRASADLQDPIIGENVLRASLDAVDPSSNTGVFRASMRVA
jgi:hypothetical protein